MNRAQVSFTGHELESQDRDRPGCRRPRVDRGFLRRTCWQQSGPIDIQVGVVMHEVTAQDVGAFEFARGDQEGPGTVRHDDLAAFQSRAANGAEFGLPEYPEHRGNSHQYGEIGLHASIRSCVA